MCCLNTCCSQNSQAPLPTNPLSKCWIFGRGHFLITTNFAYFFWTWRQPVTDPVYFWGLADISEAALKFMSFFSLRLVLVGKMEGKIHISHILCNWCCYISPVDDPGQVAISTKWWKKKSGPSRIVMDNCVKNSSMQRCQVWPKYVISGGQEHLQLHPQTKRPTQREFEWSWRRTHYPGPNLQSESLVGQIVSFSYFMLFWCFLSKTSFRLSQFQMFPNQWLDLCLVNLAFVPK